MLEKRTDLGEVKDDLDWKRVMERCKGAGVVGRAALWGKGCWNLDQAGEVMKEVKREKEKGRRSTVGG